MKSLINPCQPFLNLKRTIILLSVLLLPCLFFSRAFAQQNKWVSPKEAQILKDPLLSDKATLVEGKTLYTTNCAPCHGDKGRGDGPAAVALNPKPADHSSAAIQSETDGSLFWKLSEGRKPMPAYKAVLTEKQRWALVKYIRTLAKSPKK